MTAESNITADSFAPVVLAPPSTVLRGPADADYFRVSVGRFKDRFYCDPLPGDELFPEDGPDASYPSVSVIKKATGQDWSDVAIKRIASAPDLDEIARLPFDERKERLRTINKLGLDRASTRGSNVHTKAESLLYGVPCRLGNGAAGTEYFAIVDKIFNDLQPELVAAEFPVFHRTLNGRGYGGTADAIIKIGGKAYLVDWKSRGADSRHGAYPEEGAQAGAYGFAEYMMVDDGDGGVIRRRLPELDGGLIISIQPDSYEVYPIDLVEGFAHFSALHAWWVARRSERKSIGRKWPPRRADSGESRDVEPSDALGSSAKRRARLLERFFAMSAEQQDEFTGRCIPSADLDAIEKALDDIENPPTTLEMAQSRMADEAARKAEGATNTGDAPEGQGKATEISPDGPSEDKPAHEPDVEASMARFNGTMTSQQRAWTGSIVAQAIAGNVDFRMSARKTQRRADIYWSLTKWAVSPYWHPEHDDGFLAAVHMVLLDDRVFSTSFNLGVALGGFSAEQAHMLRLLIDQICADELVLDVDETSSQLRWKSAANKGENKK